MQPTDAQSDLLGRSAFALLTNPVPVRPASSALIARSPAARNAGDRDVPILFALNEPRLILFSDFLADEECDELIDLARDRLRRSTVVSHVDGSHRIHPARTSEDTCFARGENHLVTKVENRISRLLQIPVSRGEQLNIVRYLPGAHFHAHHDYFSESVEGHRAALANGNQRFATLLMYLSDVDGGGATSFPDLGLDIVPQKGNALFFANADSRGAGDPRTLHGARPVVTGEKWVATKWMRLKDCDA
jgi:prolyl 4-hydroxylase